MTNNEARKALIKSGFELHRASKKTTIWKKDQNTVAISNGNKENPHTTAEVEMVIRRANTSKLIRSGPLTAKVGDMVKMVPASPKEVEQALLKEAQKARIECGAPHCFFKGTVSEMAMHVSVYHPKSAPVPDTFGRILPRPEPKPEVLQQETEPPRTRGCGLDGSRKLTPEERKIAATRITRLYSGGISYAKIAIMLNDDGVVSGAKDGKWSEQTTWAAARRAAKRKKVQNLRNKKIREGKIAATVDTPTPPIAPPPTAVVLQKKGIPVSIQFMLEDPDLNTAQRVASIRPIVGKLPVSIGLMLDDPDLSPDLKMDILLGVLKAQ
jgi:hypothetical protein